MAIITVEDYKAFAGITGTGQDIQIANGIAAAQAMMERYCGRASFDSGAQTDNLDGEGQPWVQVTRPPITALTSITIRHSDTSTTVYDSSAEIDASFRYDTDGTGGVIQWINAQWGRFPPLDYWDDPSLGTRFGASPAFRRGFRNLAIVYTGGFSAATMPADLKQVCRRMVAREMSDAMVGAIQSETIGGYSYTRAVAAELDERDRRQLAPFVLGRSMAG